LLDFERSILNLCCGFIVIDISGNVAMIHQTAREYLLGGSVRPFIIDQGAAHEDLFSSCMQCLTTGGLRVKVARNQMPEFLDYAATSWSSHLSSTRPDSRKIAQSLKKFVTGAWVLTWIGYLAATSQLSVLSQASRHLSRY